MKKLCEASLRVDTRLLKMLAMADIQGRSCKDKPALMEAAELFEMLCREQDCWGKARSFATNHARFQSTLSKVLERMKSINEPMQAIADTPSVMKPAVVPR